MKINVIGLGYIGLPTAALLASRGFDVHGVDLNRQTVQAVNKGELHIDEPDLDSILKSVVSIKKLKASSTVKEAECYLIAVPTPFKKNHEPDLSYLKNASEAIAPLLKKGDLIIIESTSPIGTTEQVIEWVHEIRSDLELPHAFGQKGDIHFAYCPERVLPGKIVHELTHNDRVIGGINNESAIAAKKIYKTFVMGQCYITDSRTAEMVKLTENAYRDTNIAFANEISMICDDWQINPWELIDLVNKHPRVNMLTPGPGVGGHCIAVDPWFIVHASPEKSKLIKTSRLVNDSKTDFAIEKIVERIKLLDNPCVSFFGLTYKANTDDTRESPALTIVETIAKQFEHTMHVVEPFLKELPKELKTHKHIQKIELDDALEKSDLLILLVEHDVFQNISIKKLSQKYVIDFKGIWTSF